MTPSRGVVGAASANAQSYNDIQLSAQSSSTLYVVNTDCAVDLFGMNNFRAGLAYRQAGNWLSTTGIEQLLNKGQLAESTPYNGV